jgi:hypothetical protein
MNLEIQPKNGSHCVLRAGKEIARFNSIEAAEAFVMSESRITEARRPNLNSAKWRNVQNRKTGGLLATGRWK